MFFLLQVKPLSFYSGIMFVIESIIISEQITEYRFRAFLDISNKFSTNLYLNDFAVQA